MVRLPERGIAYAVCAALFYGQVPVLAKLAFNNGAQGLLTILLRTIIVATVLALISLAARKSLKLTRAALLPFILQCAATVAVSSGIILSVQFIPASLAVIIFFVAPVIVLLLGPLIEGQKLSAARVAIGLCLFAGLAVAIGPDFSQLDVRGILLASLAAAGYVFQFFSGRALAQHLAPTSIGALVHLAVFPAFLLLAFTFGIEPRAPNTLGAFAMLGVGIAYILGYTLQMASLANASASRVVPFFNLEPIVTTLAAAFVLNEILSFNQYLGGAIVLASLLVASRLKN